MMLSTSIYLCAFCLSLAPHSMAVQLQLSAASAQVYTPSGGAFSILKNITTKSDKVSCASNCSAVSSCTAFSFNATTSLCYLGTLSNVSQAGANSASFTGIVFTNKFQTTCKVNPVYVSSSNCSWGGLVSYTDSSLAVLVDGNLTSCYVYAPSIWYMNNDNNSLYAWFGFDFGSNVSISSAIFYLPAYLAGSATYSANITLSVGSYMPKNQTKLLPNDNKVCDSTVSRKLDVNATSITFSCDRTLVGRYAILQKTSGPYGLPGAEMAFFSPCAHPALAARP